MNGKRILVTGGAGFIGSHTAEALLAAGAEVVVLDNYSAGKEQNLRTDDRLRIIRGDIRDIDAVRKAIASVDAVMHLAAQVSVRDSIQQPVNSAQHNVVGFLNVLEAAREAGVRRVVYASSAAVYGVPQTLPLDESSPVAPISPYGLEKLVNEHYAALYQSLHGLECLGLRYFNVYGPRQDPASQYAGVITKFSSLLQRGEPLHIFGDGLQTRDFVYVKDIARANVSALAGDVTGVVAVGTGKSVTLLELVATLGRCVGRQPQVIHEAPVPGDIPRSAMSPAKLENWLGWKPSTSLADGIGNLLR